MEYFLNHPQQAISGLIFLAGFLDFIVGQSGYTQYIGLTKRILKQIQKLVQKGDNK